MRWLSRRSFLSLFGGLLTASAAVLGIRRRPSPFSSGVIGHHEGFALFGAMSPPYPKGEIEKLRDGQFLYTEDAIYYAHPDTEPVRWSRAQDPGSFDPAEYVHRFHVRKLHKAMMRAQDYAAGIFWARGGGMVG